MVSSFWYTHEPNYRSLFWFWRCKERACPLSPHLGLRRMLEVPDWGLASWSWFGYGHWSLINPWSKFCLFILILKVQRTSMSFKSLFGSLEDAGCSWLRFCILILIWIWSLVFDTPMTQILHLCLPFEGAKNQWCNSGQFFLCFHFLKSAINCFRFRFHASKLPSFQQKYEIWLWKDDVPGWIGLGLGCELGLRISLCWSKTYYVLAYAESWSLKNVVNIIPGSGSSLI